METVGVFGDRPGSERNLWTDREGTTDVGETHGCRESRDGTTRGIELRRLCFAHKRITDVERVLTPVDGEREPIHTPWVVSRIMYYPGGRYKQLKYFLFY